MSQASGSVIIRAVDRGAGLGAVEYLTKLIRLEVLLQKVGKHLPPGGA